MKKEKVHPDKSKQSRRHPISQRLVVGLLCICLSMMSMPMNDYSYRVLAAQGREIVMFPALPEYVREQTVEPGTPLEALELPDTLTAVCRMEGETVGEVHKESADLQAVTEEVHRPKAYQALPETEREHGTAVVGSSQDAGASTEEEIVEAAAPEASEESVTQKEDSEASEEPTPEEPTVPEGNPETPEEPTVPEGDPEIPAEPVPPEDTSVGEQTETVTIEGITWTSQPEYDKDTAGTYVFRPKLPEVYTLTAEAGLPEIYVTVEAYVNKRGDDAETGKREQQTDTDNMNRLNKKALEQALEGDSESEAPAETGIPACGTISTDTEWTQEGTLSGGELIVNPGVTLTVNKSVTIDGNVTIRGGGTIVRGAGEANFSVETGKVLTLGDITLEGNGVSADKALILVKSGAEVSINSGSKIQNCKSSASGGAIDSLGKLILNGGIIQNCTASFMGGAIYMSMTGGSVTVKQGTVIRNCSALEGGAIAMFGGTLTIENATIENCSAEELGGAILERGGKVIIRDGKFQNNKTKSSDIENWTGGGFICLCGSSLEIYGGEFTGNSSASHGGAIYHCGCEGTSTDIKGGYFAGNTCSHPKFKGSGAIYNSTQYEENTSMTLSGRVQFCGDGNSGSGTDGVYLDQKKGSDLLRKIFISDTLSYPVTLYLEAIEGRVIAEGVKDYVLLKNRDVKKINFVDVGSSDEIWYAELDEENNQVKITKQQPDYGHFLYYIIPRNATGKVEDDTSYQIGDKAEIQSAAAINYDGYIFKEWNTKEDGSGDSYQPGDKLVVQGDTNLYAIFLDDSNKILTGSFYSGSEGQRQERKAIVAENAQSGVVKAPKLLEMDGWTPVGWNESTSEYMGDILEEEEVTLTKDTSYFGVYSRAVVLTYEAEGAQAFPEPDTGECRANVHNKITTVSAEFHVGSVPTRPGYVFTGWNTKPDGTGENYWEGDTLVTDEDMTLYAVFQKYVTANFYSGKAGRKESKNAEVADDAVSAAVTTPGLAELEGWEPVGWDLDPDGYDGEIAADTQVELTRNTDYYGVYKKGVTLTYDAKGAEDTPGQETGECRANVHEEVTTTSARFVIAPVAARAGSAFAGWNTKADGTGIMYLPGDSLRTQENVTLYAVYQKTVTADFYSGGAGKKETKAVSIEDGATIGTVTAPELAELEGWEPMGWDTETDRYHAMIQIGEEITLERNASFYGVYRKNVTVSYDGNGVDTAPEGESKECRANVHEDISYDTPGFLLAQAPVVPGYRFCGWNTSPAGTGKTYQAGSWHQFTEDITLYACWEAQEAPYQVEHYKQELEGGSYILEETERCTGIMDAMAQARAKAYEGFTENPQHGSRKAEGRVKADGSLTLKLFYDRDAYQVFFDLNGGVGEIPEPQEVRYGDFLEPVVEPERPGYTFYGWYMDEAGSEGSQWEFGRTVEENTASSVVTLYAKWVDDIAPALGKASFGKGYKHLFNWLISREAMKITVPITEEGSGVKHVYYTLIPDGDKLMDADDMPASSVYLEEYGQGIFKASENASTADSQQKGSSKAKIRTEEGKITAEFMIEPDFKGQISMLGTDNAGNVSVRKVLTAEGGGIILEDHAPEITFTAKEKAGDSVNIEVLVTDIPQEEVTAGIAAISYQVDDGAAMVIPEEEFAQELTEEYQFKVELRGEGRHTLRVNAEDHAGNLQAREASLEITVHKATAPDNNKPGSGEPKTGDGTNVEIYATASMIAGFTYLLLYFKSREHGMTEEKKRELVSRLVNWAKGSRGIKRLLALTAIFLLLAYYHSIGKNVSEEWREVCEK